MIRSGLVRPRAAVLGAGPAGLMAAERLAAAGVQVRIVDQTPSPARKFLMAGRGGLNLSHSEAIDSLLARYGDARTTLTKAITTFPTSALRDWASGLGIQTFVGSSGRVFPSGLKASPLLRAWLRRLHGLGVEFDLRTRWAGFGDDGSLILQTPDGTRFETPDVAVFALGGASWPRLGSDGGWSANFAEAGVAVAPFRPSNCGFAARWSPLFASRFAGAPLKRVAIMFEGRTARGEALVTADGLEGGLVYAFSSALRDAIERDGVARPTLDLRPDVSVDQLAAKLSAPRGKRSLSTHLAKAAGLSPAAIGTLREAGPPPADPADLATRLKAVPLTLTAPAGLDRAISSAGGVRLDEVDETFMLKRRPGVYVVGEMLDWEAPTGGYLIHACLATARLAGDAAARRLGQPPVGGRAPILDSTSDGASS